MVRLTGNFYSGRLTPDVPSAGPSEARALVLVTAEVLVHGLPRHLVFSLYDPHAGLGVHELEVYSLCLHSVALEVDLEIIRRVEKLSY